MSVLAIDPGTTKSGWLVFDEGRVLACGVNDNPDVLEAVRYTSASIVAIEMIASYGMAVGSSVFETVRWIGRFQQAAPDPERVMLVYRQDIKLFLCKSLQANDANVRQALIDRVGTPGTKAKPGATYGVYTHAWAALGVAVTAVQFQAGDRKGC